MYFDIAAFVVMFVALASFLMRRKTSSPANRVYLSALILVLLTTLLSLAADVCDLTGIAASKTSGVDPAVREAIQVFYYALRSLTAPTYFILIATVSDTTHLLNKNNLVRLALWVPMVAILVLVLTNPFHHVVFAYENGANVRHSGVIAIYSSTAYYSLVGVCWLFRWKTVLSDDEFATLMMLYPLVLLAVVVQYHFASLHVEMFATSVAIMLVSAFVMQPERQNDSLVDAASLQSYRDMCRRAFITKKPLCLVYLEIVNMERLRELVGKDELQNVVRRVAANLARTLEPGDVLYYLRNGLFCISPVNTDANHALMVAGSTHEEGKTRDDAQLIQINVMEMRVCVVRVPEDVKELAQLSNFVRRFAHLVPDSGVTSFAELSRKDDFALNMALSDCIEHAIQKSTFEVYYQPIYRLSTGRFESAEALVRMHDPRYGYISPDLFIPEAEQSGAILAIGSILLKKICAFLESVDFESTGLRYVEVNLSTEQCVRSNMADELLALMQEYRVSPERINLEITETSATYSQNIVDQNVRALARQGVTFSLDDYGTGYSNVTRMLSLPFEIVKFDKSFVNTLDDEDARTVFAASIAMMKQIGKEILVEGVETQEQADALCAMGADYIQGYLYARPLPEDEFLAFLRKHNA